MFLDKLSPNFSPEQVTPEQARRTLEQPGSWLLYKENGKPTAVRCLDERRYFSISLREDSVFKGKCVQAAVVVDDRGGSYIETSLLIKTDRFGNVMQVVVDSKPHSEVENILREYKRRSLGRDWQFCVYQVRDKKVWLNGSHAATDYRYVKTMLKKHPIQHKQYPPHRFGSTHYASLAEVTNRKSASMIVGWTPKFENGMPKFPTLLLNQFRTLVRNPRLQSEELHEHLETLTSECLDYLTQSGDLEAGS